MFGKNQILPPENSDGKLLKIHSIFDTLQGEGIYSGVPAVFVRLSGCNLACSFCDTDFDSYEIKHVDDIIAIIKNYSIDYHKLVVITGGEPFRQPISLLCATLINLNFTVQIETNGLLYRKIPNEVDVICSPKPSKNGYATIRADLMQNVRAIKFLISASQDGYGNIAEVGQSEFNVKVYVQPMDENDQVKNQSNVRLAIKLAKKHNAILSLQLHKILGIE